MSLYLTVFDGDTEMAGWVFGHYDDFDCFLNCIRDRIPGAIERFPVFMQHSDCDGEWSVNYLTELVCELDEIAAVFERLPPAHPKGASAYMEKFRRDAKNLYECFHNVDGEYLFDALRDLARLALSKGLPILFQ
jgi:hypothetical protein